MSSGNRRTETIVEKHIPTKDDAKMLRRLAARIERDLKEAEPTKVQKAG